MSKLTKSFLYMAVVSAWFAAPAVTVYGQSAVADQHKAQTKLLAYRAARVDAIRKLAERIDGLQLTSDTTVKDFVTENDTIRTAVNAFLNGMRESGKPQYNDDGTCEVTMEVTIETVATTLKEIHNRYAKGDKFKASDFTEMITKTDRKILKETGSGAPRQEWSNESTFVPVPKDESYKNPSYMSASAAAYWKANVMPQGRLMALLAARIDGMRKLVERIYGTGLNSQTIVRDFVTEKDDINAMTAALLRGARETSINYHDDEPVVEVEMSVTLETITTVTKSFLETRYKGDVSKIKYFEDQIQKTDRKVISETGSGVVGERFLKIAQPAGMMETLQDASKWPASISATGSAAIDIDNDNKAQAKLMAERGAELDARRKLAEQLDGLVVRSSTTVKDFVTQNDTIKTAMMTFQQGAYVVEGSKKVNADGTVEVTVAIDTAPLWDIVTHYSKTTVVKSTKATKVAPEATEEDSE